MGKRFKGIIENNRFFILFFGAVILLFLHPLITCSSGMIDGDYLVQFYPWSKLYSEAIKNFNLPFWTRYFHSGFPLMAEGQIGGFYPLNIIMFFVLPFKFAYNYSAVLHFILAGIFTYIYARKIGAGEQGGTLAALLFCFGSAYAGCFYNIATLRTLVWFPLVLLLMEGFLESNLNSLSPKGERARVRGLSYIIASGIIAGMQFLAGFIQMAAYSFGFYIIYLLYGLRLKKVSLKRRVLALLLFSGFAVLIASPQIILTYQLARASGRVSASLGFALWRSFPPPCFLTLFFPRWMGFLGHQLFLGVLSILFLIYATIDSKNSHQIRPLILIGVVSIFVALGKYNPLYVAILKATRFYSFRNPSKLLFFGLFAGSVLAGFGFSKFFSQLDKKLIRKATSIFSWILAISASIFFISKMLVWAFKDRIIVWLEAYVLKYVFGKPYHRYDLQTYMDKVHSIYQSFINDAALNNPFVLFSVVMVVVCLLLAISIYIRPDRARLLKIPVLCIIFLDIFVYSFYGTGFKGNIKPFSFLKPTHTRILEILKSDKELFRIAPFDLKDEKMPIWAMPNANILAGIDSIAAYTPLVEASYKEAILPLEVVDDALGLLSPSNQALADKYQLLRLLNVKYLVSPRRLRYGFLRKIISDNGIFLYQVKGFLPRAFFTYRIDGNIRSAPTRDLKVKEYKSGLIRIEVSTDRDGFLVFSENHYPGWGASIDGKRVEIIPVKGLIQAVRIDKGRHRFVFRFKIW